MHLSLRNQLWHSCVDKMPDTEACSVENTLHPLRRLRLLNGDHPVACIRLVAAHVDDHDDDNQQVHGEAHADVDGQGPGKDKGIVSDPAGFPRRGTMGAER